MSKERISLGKQGEETAAAYLTDKGYQIVMRNYRQKCGEIDIICKDGNCWVFVEVKTRQKSGFGHPLEAVTVHKQLQMSRTAVYYLSKNRMLDTPARFDVVGIEISKGKTEITHIIDAFEAG